MYVYVVYLPGNPICTIGAWQDYEAAKKWTEGNYEDGNEPDEPGRKKYRIAQVPIVRADAVEQRTEGCDK